MKKTFPVNISGKVFYIDEDAYELLLNYLDQLRAAFSDAEGEEIVTDIESRIAELFDERISQGANAIVYSDVNRVIEIMGKPSDISENDETEVTSEGSEASESPINDAAAIDLDSPAEKKKLFRNINNKVLGGVISGLATYLDWDINIMRVLYLVLAVATYFWPLTLLYLVAWMIIPAANTPRRVLEMRGEPVTVDTIGQTVLSSTTPPPYPGIIIRNDSNIFSNILSFLGKCIIALLGLIGGAGALVATGFFLFFLIALIAFSCFSSITLIDFFDPHILRISLHYAPVIGISAYMCIALCFIIPGIALAWMAAAVLFNCKGAAKSTIIFAMLLEVILIVSAFILMIFRDGIVHHY